jgi:hypothetical protein
LFLPECGEGGECSSFLLQLLLLEKCSYCSLVLETGETLPVPPSPVLVPTLSKEGGMPTATKEIAQLRDK